MKSIKKMAISISLLLVMIITVACGSGSKSDTYVLEKDGGIATVTLYHDEKEVSKLESEMTLPYQALHMDPSQKEQIKQSISMVESMIKSIKGVEMKFDLGDDKVKLNMNVDYSQIDMEQIKNLAQMGGQSMPVGDLESMKDFKKAEKSLLDAGFVKK